MAPTKQTAFRLPADLMASIQAIKDRDGIPLAEQVRRALATWVQERGIETPAAKKTARGRGAARKQA